MRLCVNNQTAFGGMLQQLVELTSIVLRPEPLDAEIERRCKQAWKEAPCPDCGETIINAGDGSPRLWCANCRYTFTYTRNTPFERCILTPGEVIIAFILYADTLLSIAQHQPSCSALRGGLRYGSHDYPRGEPPRGQAPRHSVCSACRAPFVVGG